MEIGEKLDILADAAKYDVSCSSSGSARANGGGLGNAHKSGICHTWTAIPGLPMAAVFPS